MNQRKTMKLWQMIVLIILLVALLVTMFLPAYHINGNALIKMYKVIQSQVESNPELEGLVDLFGKVDEEDLNEQKEEFDEEIREAEKEEGIKISSITPGNIMIHSCEAFWGDAYEDMDMNSDVNIKSGYNAQRILLWIIYMLIIAVIIVIVLGFCLKWTKYIALIISAVYGIGVAVVFGIWQFLSPSVVVDGMDIPGLLGIAGLSADSAQQAAISSVMTKIISCFWGITFLVGFIIAVLLVIMSVVSMFVGGYSTASNGNSGGDGNWNQGNGDIFIDDPGQQDWERQERERQERERRERERQERERQERERQERERQQQVVTPPMGLVRCTKGAAAGQGFSLPEDRKVVVGKSMQNANLLVGSPHVSNIHCSIRYKAVTNSYIVKDHSTNGTFVNGVRLQKDVPMEFPAGTVLQLADGSNEITLG